MNVLPLNTRSHNNIHTTNTEGGPTAAELDTIDAEMPVIDAEVDLLDVEIALLDRTPNELGARRLRRAHRKVLLARLEVANRATESPEVA